ncbi:MAG TPA: 3-isopropylmalate dehydratase small subunit [Woeseiaceae bacterium]|nr:3-isopropylmalate dehydratase small subunit [Woeseiaceae bacterium]
MKPLHRITSRTIALPVDDIDTDQIIPARYLTTTSRDGLGQYLFADWRYRPDGSINADFELNRAGAQNCEILVAGRNFGCGSSREHAPWALLDYGFRAVISSEIADIFRSNALKNGLLPVVVPADVLDWLLAHSGAEVGIDVSTSVLTLPDGRQIDYPIDRFSRFCLLEGTDQLGFLLQQEDYIRRFEEHRPWTP